LSSVCAECSVTRGAGQLLFHLLMSDRVS
jgi:hypothetical protein